MSQGLRILHLGNGTAFKIKAIVDASLERGHEIHMIPIPPSQPGWEGVEWHVLPELAFLGPAKVAARFALVRRLVSRIRPDLIHAHNAWGPGWYGAATGIHPFVIHAYGGDLLAEQYQERPLLQRRLTAWACRAADRIIVTGEHMIAAAAELGVPRDTLMRLPRGVDTQGYRPGLETGWLRQRLDLGQAWPILLSPRYQVDEGLYNLDTLIEAFAIVRQSFPDALCLQLFDPRRESGRASLAAMAAERGLGETYRLVPAVDNATMPFFYNLADVVVSVPSSDGFPVTVLEASACAAPLVVSRLPYCSEWFVDGENGFLVSVRDVEGLSSTLVKVLSDAEMRRRCGLAGRRLVEERADYRRCMDALDLEYRQLVTRARLTPAPEGC